MSNTETQYFALLRAALWGAPVDFNEAVDWNGIMRIAEHHGNEVLLADCAARMNDGDKPSASALARMQTVMRNNLIHQMSLRQILVSAVKLLREHHIEPVLLKGFGLALLYPNPGLRQFGDIDLFVGLADFHEACRLLRTLPGGYNWRKEEDVGRHYNIEFGQYPMEVHRISADIENAKEQAVYTAIEQEGLSGHLQRADLDGFEVSIPSKEFVVFFTFYHAWHHFLTTGVGWRQLSDVALALHAYHGQLDLDKLRQWLADMHVMLPWQTFGYLMVDCLGLPETELPFYDPACRSRARRLYAQVMREGNFKRINGFKQNKPKYRFWHRVQTFIGVFINFYYRARVFPASAFREMITTLRQAFIKKGANGAMEKK